MGLFSKPKPAKASIPQDQIDGLVKKFQDWVPDNFSKKINGQKYDSSQLRQAISVLVNYSAHNEDTQLLQFVGKNCAGMSGTMKDEPIESTAQWLFDGTAMSMELRRKYSENKQLLDAISAIGLAAMSFAESLPNYQEVLEYMSVNAHKLNKG
jgi:hypothetical protein